MLYLPREETKGKLEMLLSPRKDGLDSLFKEVRVLRGGIATLGGGPNTVSESTVSNTELSEFFGLSEFRGEDSVSSSQPIICVPKRTHRVFLQNSPSLPQNSVRLSEFPSPKQYSRNIIPPVSYTPVSRWGGGGIKRSGHYLLCYAPPGYPMCGSPNEGEPFVVPQE